MNLIDTFKSPFKLIATFHYNNPCNGFRATFKTNTIIDETTKGSIYILSKMYFDNLVSKFKIFRIGDRLTTESTYRLFVEQVEDCELQQKHIYSIAYNNIEDKISWENKFDDDFTIVEGNFRIGIDISAYVVEDYEDEDEDPTPPKRAIFEPECIICFEKQPDILYTECLHRVVCVSCDTKGEFKRCPMCRTRINNNRIKI